MRQPNTLADKNMMDQSTVKVATYTNSDNSCMILLYTVVGGGHSLPGSNTLKLPNILGHKNKDIYGARVIMDFFIN